RIDDVVLFGPLRLEEIQQIVGLMLNDLRRRLADRRVGLELTAAAQEFVAREGYDPTYGARPLKRFLQRQLETRIGRALIAGDVTEGATLEVDLRDGELAVDIGAPPATAGGAPAEDREPVAASTH
ncbi:MAG: type VI secretion system ATPase TssH, partial [Acidobacteriota bacterium]